MENDELKNFLELHSNNECFKEAINPILKKNYWQINFPLWADKVESFSSEQIIASLLEIIMTLIYQYYKIAIFKVIKTEEQKRIKEINNKYLSLNKYSAIPDLFDIIRKNAFSPPKKLLCDQFEEFLQSHNIKRDETIDTREKCEAFIKDTLNEFETKDIIEFWEKMKQFFEKLTYVYIFDIKENKYKHIVYYYLREHIMKYIPFNGLTNQINYIVNEQDKMNEKYNIYKEKMLKETKDFIECELKKDFTLKFVDYGSHYSNLYLPDSDLDFRVFFKEKDKMNPVNENEFMQKLDEIFGKMKKEIQKNPNNQYHLEVKSRPRANPPLFTLQFNLHK